MRLSVRLAVVILTLAIPLGALLVTLLLTERDAALSGSRESLRRLALLAAEQEDDALQEASNLLRVLSRVSDVTGGATDACHQLVRELVNEHPRIDTILVAEPDGQVSCESGSPAPRGISVADREWFRDATGPDAPPIVMSGLVTSRLTGKLTLVVATPIRRATGMGSLSAGLNLSWFTSVGERLGGENGVMVSVVSATTRMVLSSSGAGAGLPGTILPPSPMFDLLLSDRSGVFEDGGVGGDGRIYGFARLPWTGGPQAAVLVSRDRDGVIGAANRRLLLSLALLTGVIAVGAAASMGLALAFVIRPLRRLVAAARTMGLGQLEARVPLRLMRGPEFRVLATVLNETAGRLAERERELAELAIRDGLTGLANRRRFDVALLEAWRAGPAPVGLAMIDIDQFKAYNDAYGHLAGDMVLRHVAQALSTTMRKGPDLVARYGGEEFVVLAPGVLQDGAEIVGARLAAAVRELEIPHSGSPTGFVTVSVGTSWAMRGLEGHTAEGLLQRADEALYMAKRAGRDRAVFAQHEGSGPAERRRGSVAQE